MKKKKSKKHELTPHINAKVHASIMKRLSRMSVDEIFETAVRSGIYTKTGKLKKLYKGE